MVGLRDDLKVKKPVIGLQRTLKKIRKQQLKRVYVSSNSNVKENISHLGKSFGVEVVVVGETSKEIGILCKKPFSISVISFE